MNKINIFDKYIKAGLIPSLGGNDDIYLKLKISAQAISEDLSGTPAKIIRYTLVALDNGITEQEPILVEVEQKITENWQMIRSQYPEMPIPLYRAVILQALEDLIEENVEWISSVWFAGVDVFPYLDVPHKEEKILSEFFNALGDAAEERATQEWTIAKDKIKIEVPTLEFKQSKATAEVDKNALEEYLIAASGPSGKDGKARENSNQYWPNSNNHWSYEFAPRAATGLATVINKGLSTLSQAINQFLSTVQKSMNEYFEALTGKMQAALTSSIQSSVAVERRSQLLWWKETLYSQKLKKSYRKFSPFESAIAMAMDLYYLLPAVFPVSVDHILREAFGSIYGHENKTIKMIDFFNEVNESIHRPFLEKYFEEETVEKGRTDLTSFMQKVIYSKVDLEKELTARLGVTPEKEISYQDLSIWILHSFSAKHLTSN